MSTSSFTTNQLVVIDRSLSDYQGLIQQLPAGMSYLLIDPLGDGLAQLSESLKGISNLSAIHIISHGTPGNLTLGGLLLNESNLANYTQALARIGQSLSQEGDILLYGCNVAGDESGIAFVQRLSELTGAEVAASDNATGALGDWTLEAATGSVETASLQFANYAASLAVVPGTDGYDNLNGGAGDDSLVGYAGNDTLNGGAGNDTLNGGTGADSLTGGTGMDTAVYAGSASGYRFTVNSTGQLQILDTNSADGYEGLDTLLGIERARFTDGEVAIQLFGEQRVNTSTSREQLQPSVTSLAGGGLVVSWVSDREILGYADLYTQRIDADGNFVGGQTQVNTYRDDVTHTVTTSLYRPTGYGYNYAVAGSAEGGYAVWWHGERTKGDMKGIHAKPYDANGEDIHPDFQDLIKQTENIDLGDYGYRGGSEFSMAPLSQGGYVLVWWAVNQEVSGADEGHGIYAQRHDADGDPMGDPIQANSDANAKAYPSEPVVAALSDGGYAVAWTSAFDGSSDGIYARRFDAQGNPAGGEIQVNTFTDGAQTDPDIAALADGGFIVTWRADGLFTQRYDANGNAVGKETRLTEDDLLYRPGSPSITGLADGGYVVTWVESGANYSNDIFSHRYDANGKPVGVETRVNTYANGYQVDPDVAALPDGGYVVTWSGQGVGDVEGIFSQRFDAFGDPLAAIFIGDDGANTLAWSGTGNVILKGGLGSDTLAGGNGKDKLYGGAGTDSLKGGGGNDLYFIDQSGDVILELGDGGADTAYAEVNYVLSANVENLILTGTADLNGAGSGDANTLTGNSGNNSLSGAAGNDTLMGGGGADTLRGGTGDDQMHIDSADDRVIEDAGEGLDTVLSAIDYSLTDNVENLVLATGATNGQGNDLANRLTGNDVDNVLTGGAGNDTLDGGKGVDRAVLLNTSSGYQFSLSGGQLRVTDNDSLNGVDEGSDTLIDIEQVQFTDGTVSAVTFGERYLKASDPMSWGITALPDGGYLTTWHDQGYANGFEERDNSSAVLAQHYDANGYAVGTETRINTTTLGAQYDAKVTALAYGGYVVAWSGKGANGKYGLFTQRYDADGDKLGGETRVDNYGTTPDLLALADGGYVVAWDGSLDTGDIFTRRFDMDGSPLGETTQVTSYTQSGTLYYSSMALLADGDYLVTWSVYDSFGEGIAGSFAQRFRVDGIDTYAVGGEITIDSHKYSLDPAATGLSDGSYLMAWSGKGLGQSDYDYDLDVFVQRYDGSGAPLGPKTVVNAYTTGTQTRPVMTMLEDGSYLVVWDGKGAGDGSGIFAKHFDAEGNALGAEFRVNPSTAGVQYNAKVTALTDGGYLVTWESGGVSGVGAGIYAQRFDRYDNALSAKLTGDGVANSLTWTGAGHVILDGRGGNDVLRGGIGNDQLMGGAGGDRLSGAEGVDHLWGNDGKDTLDGGIGADQLQGGAGDDTYFVDNAADEVIELAGQGVDTVKSSITLTLGQNLENLTLTGSSASNGTGNGMANTLNGNAYANLLKGLGGNDKLAGFGGNDTLIGGGGQDTLDGGAGKDTAVFSEMNKPVSVSLNLASDVTAYVGGIAEDTLRNIENLKGGTAGDSLAGDSNANVLYGYAGKDTLSGGLGNDQLLGGAGNDSLTGGDGSDIFCFNTALNATNNRDTVTDFVAAVDRIQLENSIFVSLTATGILSSDNFIANASGAPMDGDDFILYNSNTGALFYDADGNGPGLRIQFATLVGHPAISNMDFMVV